MGWNSVTLPSELLDDAWRRGRDNFLPLRHIAALLVILGHSFRLSGTTSGRVDFVERLMPGFHAGSIAVFLFFAISGFLVTASLVRQPGLWRYVRHRFLRIYPAYFACLVLMVVVLGPAFTTLDIAAYFHSAGTWGFFVENLSPIKLAWKLPGVFEGNPYPGVVNGSLWSLGLEVRWYAYLGVLALLGVVSRRWLFSVVALGFLGFATWEAASGKPDPLGFRALSMVFVGAALLAQWKHRVRVGHGSMAVLVFACMLASGTGWFHAIAIVAAGWSALWFAYVLPPLPWPRGRDVSYGLFLYGFPVQQGLVATWPGLGPWSLFALASAASFVLAALSWHLVEAPALRLARSRDTPPAQPQG